MGFAMGRLLLLPVLRAGLWRWLWLLVLRANLRRLRSILGPPGRRCFLRFDRGLRLRDNPIGFL
jgi:hypothetical protein